MAKRKASPSDSDSEAPEAKASKRLRRLESLHEKEFDAKYTEFVKAQILRAEKHIGTEAEYGIIQSLEMHQFMCHRRLSFKFGPQINFIVGHNGSGKSAVLSAITIALGGKSIITGRGSSLKSFIREGENRSEVTVTLKNEGEFGFRREEYGDSIVITRSFTRDGISSYKIKSKEGRVISTAKKELSAICEHMDIHIDNPLNILTQDSARKFLSTSKPTDRYEFFLRGTQLRHLIDDYENCANLISKTTKVLQKRAELIPVLREDEEKAAARYKVAQKALKIRDTITNLKKELAWSYVEKKDEESKEKLEDMAKTTRRISKVQENIGVTDAKIDAVNIRVVELESELASLGNIDKLNETKAKLGDEINENKSQLREIQDNIRKMNEDLQSNKEAINLLDSQIAEEAQKMQVDKQAERNERHLKLDELKKSIEEQELLLRAVTGDQQSKKEQHIDLTRQLNDAATEKGKAEQEMKGCREQLQRIDQQAKDRLNAFGKNLEGVIRRIRDCHWHGETPVGPLGCFVNLQDQKWAPVLRIQLGSLVRSFAITSPHDKNQLKRILSGSGNSDMQIIVAEVDLFDYSSGEPPCEVLTVLRALTFTNEYVKRIFITKSHIEKILLAQFRIDGQRAARALPGGGTAWTGEDHYRVVAYSDGGLASSPMTRLSRNDPRLQLFMDNDLSKEKRTCQESGRQALEKLLDASNANDQISLKLEECKSELDELNRDVRNVKARLQVLQRERNILIEQDNEDVPVNIGALQETQQEYERSNEGIQIQFEHAVEKKAATEDRRRNLKNSVEIVMGQISSFEREKCKILGRIEEVVTERVELTSNLSHWNVKLQTERDIETNLNEAVSKLQEEAENWKKSAEDYCDGDKIPSPRGVDDLQRLIKSNTEVLNRQERSQGASVEEIKKALLEARQRLDITRKDLREMKTFIKILFEAVQDRQTRWNGFRMYNALQTKLRFEYNLEKRDFIGKALFKHSLLTLDLIVRTSHSEREAQHRMQELASLSGGEKSFTTLSFLLTLWGVVGCPIRCIDEFDVFMDAANRRISLEMLINFAISTDAKQYIIITPQDISAVKHRPSIRIHRMGDPGRGQMPLSI